MNKSRRKGIKCQLEKHLAANLHYQKSLVQPKNLAVENGPRLYLSLQGNSNLTILASGTRTLRGYIAVVLTLLMKSNMLSKKRRRWGTFMISLTKRLQRLILTRNTTIHTTPDSKKKCSNWQMKPSGWSTKLSMRQKKRMIGHYLPNKGLERPKSELLNFTNKLKRQSKE